VAWVRSLAGGKNFLSEHPQKIKKNKGAGKPSTYFEGSGKKTSPNVELIESQKKKNNGVKMWFFDE
jgi:hypothetical protein